MAAPYGPSLVSRARAARRAVLRSAVNGGTPSARGGRREPAGWRASPVSPSEYRAEIRFEPADRAVGAAAYAARSPPNGKPVWQRPRRGLTTSYRHPGAARRAAQPAASVLKLYIPGRCSRGSGVSTLSAGYHPV